MDTIVDLMGKLSSAPVVVLAQILLFYVFHLTMSQILYKPLLQARRERRAVTTDKVAQAQALNEATLKLKEEYEERMRQARREALSQVSSAQREAAAARQEQLDRAKAQAEAIINQAKADVESQSKTAQAELEGIAPQLALSIARRILGGMTSGEQRERVQKLLREGAHG